MNKVNTNGSFNSTRGLSGIGGIFCNDQSNLLLYFGKNIMGQLAIHAQILALKEGFLIIDASHWADSASFIFEFDSSNVFLWFSEPLKVPWWFQNIIRQSLQCFDQCL